MIVAVRAVGAVQVSRDKVVGVIAMGDHFMPATCPVLVRGVVRCATMRRGAGLGICARDFDCVLVDVAIVNVMQMPVVQVVDMARVLHFRVRAAGAVRMLVFFMDGMCHDSSIESTQVYGKNTRLACKSCLASVCEYRSFSNADGRIHNSCFHAAARSSPSSAGRSHRPRPRFSRTR